MSIHLLRSPVRWLISLGHPKTSMTKPEEVSPNICCSRMKNTKPQRSKWMERVSPPVRSGAALKLRFQVRICQDSLRKGTGLWGLGSSLSCEEEATRLSAVTLAFYKSFIFFISETGDKSRGLVLRTKSCFRDQPPLLAYCKCLSQGSCMTVLPSPLPHSRSPFLAPHLVHSGCLAPEPQGWSD